MTDEELTRWTDDFRATDAAPMPPTDQILAHAARDERKRRLEWAAQIGATAFAALAFAWLVAWTRSPIFAALAAVVLPVLFALFAFSVYARGSASSGAALSVDEQVKKLVSYRLGSYRIAQASVGAMVVLIVAFWIWWPFLVLARSERLAAEPARIVFAVVPAVLVFGFAIWFCVRALRKARHDLARWRAIAAALEEPSQAPKA